MTKPTETQSDQTPQALTDEALDGAQGGLLLPAVQAAREAARRAASATSTQSFAQDAGMETGI